LDYERHELCCPHCLTQITVESTLWQWYADYEKVHCPHCKAFICEIRADLGFKILETVLPNKKVICTGNRSA